MTIRTAFLWLGVLCLLSGCSLPVAIPITAQAEKEIWTEHIIQDAAHIKRVKPMLETIDVSCTDYYGIVFSGIRKKLPDEGCLSGIECSLFENSERNGLVDASKRGISINGILCGDTIICGLQMSGISNTECVKGLGCSLTGNFTRRMCGIQLATLCNITVANVSPSYGFQCAAGMNFHESLFYGGECALFNIANDITGGQIGFRNSAKDLKGIQFGVINSSPKLKGLQLGILNRQQEFFNIQHNKTLKEEQVYGLQIGLINMIEQGRCIQFGLLNFNGYGLPIPLLRISFN